MWVNGEARFPDYVNAKDVNVSGIITAANLNVTSGNLSVGLATLTNIAPGSYFSLNIFSPVIIIAKALVEDIRQLSA